MKFSSFSIAEMVIDEANDRFSGKYQIVPERLNILKQYCELFDELIENYDADSFEVEIDDEDLTVHMHLIVDAIECSAQQPQFGQLIQRAMPFCVKTDDGKHLRLSFVYPSLWMKKT